MNSFETRMFFHGGIEGIVEIPWNQIGKKIESDQIFDNWFFGQILSSVRSVFMKYCLPVPKYIFINRSYRDGFDMVIDLVRDNLRDEEEVISWRYKEIFVETELKTQAIANSNEDGIIFRFKII